MSYTNVRVHSSLMNKIEARKTGWQTTTALVNDLIASALDSDITLGKPLAKLAEREVLPSLNKDIEVKIPKAKSAPRDPWSIKAVDSSLVPEELAAVADEFVEWWSIRSKGAVRSQKVADREFRKLLTYSESERSKALQKAIAGGWKQLYEAKDLAPAQSRYSPAEPDVKHPAFKDAREIIKERGEEWDIPSATGGRGVLDSGAF